MLLWLSWACFFNALVVTVVTVVALVVSGGGSSRGICAVSGGCVSGIGVISGIIVLVVVGWHANVFVAFDTISFLFVVFIWCSCYVWKNIFANAIVCMLHLLILSI